MPSSFTQFLKKRFQNQLFDSVSDYVDENINHLDLHSFSVNNIDEYELEEIEIKQVYVDDRPEMSIAFDVLVEASIVVQEYDRHNDSDDRCYQWFRLCCEGDLKLGVSRFKVLEVDVYDKRKNYSHKQSLSDQLVPILYKGDLERVAEDFLQRYFPLALDTPVAIEPTYIANKMGLTVQHCEITDDCSIFGQIYFADSSEKSVKSGTILIDPRVAYIRNLGALNNTIIHECVHWDIHRKAFELERTRNSELSNISTSLNPEKYHKERSATDWMEWHAQALTPKILMPRKMFSQEAYLINKRLIDEEDSRDQLDVIERLIDELAVFFGVSRLAAKIRLVEMGYEEAIGAFNYIDGRYVPTHQWKKGAITSGQTYSISAYDAAIQSVVIPELGALLNSGKYIYVDSHFVLNIPDNLTLDIFGNLTLSQHARHHMDECCLVFDISLKTKSISDSHFILSCVLNRDKDAPYELEIKFHHGYENSTTEKQAEFLKKMVEDNNRIYATLTNDPCDCLEKVLKWRKMSKLELSKKIPCDEKTIRRIFNGESNGSMETMVAICLALYLPPEISFHIIEKSSLTFKMNDSRHQWYKFVLQTFSGKSVREARDFLKTYDVPL